MAAWTEVLDRIDETLRHSLEAAREPQQQPRSAGKEYHAALARLDARMQAWQSSLDEAEKNAARADEALAAEHAALLGCRERLGSSIEALTSWAEKRPQ